MAEEKLTASNPALVTLRNVIQKFAPDIRRLIPKHVDAEQIVMIAQAALTKNPDLLECDPRTVLGGIIQCSILGLELHTALHYASLTRFWNSKAGFWEAVLMIEYPGLIELVMRGGGVSFVESQPVYKNDFLEVEYGTNAHLLHRPILEGARGNLIGAYSYSKMTDGNTKFHWMNREDIEKRQKISKSKDKEGKPIGPWKDWEEEMYAKTPLRHLCKQLRKTTQLSIALEHENRLDQGITSVVESPNEDGLTLDFLSMNVEAKTIEQKSNLKKQLEDKKAAGKGQPPASAAPAAAQAGTDQSKAAAIDPELASLASTAPQPRNGAPSTQAAPEQPKGGTSASESLLPPGPAPLESGQRLMSEWEQEAAAFPATPPAGATHRPPPQQQPVGAPAEAPRTRRAAAAPDPLDKTIEASEVTNLMRLIRDSKIPNDKIRAYMDGLDPKVNLLRNLSVRQLRAMNDWVGKQQQ